MREHAIDYQYCENCSIFFNFSYCTNNFVSPAFIDFSSYIL